MFRKIINCIFVFGFASIVLYNYLDFEFGGKYTIFPFEYNYSFFESKKNNIYDIDLSVFRDYMLDCHNNSKICQIFVHQNWFADQIRLKSIQHAGKIDFKTFNTGLKISLDQVTTLSPYREMPYVLGLYVLPLSKSEQGFSTSKSGFNVLQYKSWTNSVELGEWGINFLCNKKRMDFVYNLSEEEITELYNKNYIKDFGIYACQNYSLPNALGFNYFYYLQLYDKSSYYYKVSAFSPNSSRIAINMSAIILGRFGYHLKSAYVRYEKFLASRNNLTIDIDQLVFYMNKAVFEYSLHLLSLVDQEAIVCNKDIVCMQKKGFLAKQIDLEIEFCSKNDDDKCQILMYALEKGYIQKDGFLEYPLNDGVEQYLYGRRYDLEDRWILPK